MRVADLVPSAPIADEHAAVLLELAFLVTSVDGKLTGREMAAFRELAARLGQATGADALAARLATIGGSEAAAARVRAIGPTLPPELRETAFQLAIAMALVDQDAAESEDELVGVFFEALGLDGARAEALAGEVRDAFATGAT